MPDTGGRGGIKNRVRWLSSERVSLAVSLLALGVAAVSLHFAYNAHEVEYGSAPGRVEPHKALAQSFADHVQINCVKEHTDLCSNYIESAERLLEEYRAAVERESSRLTEDEYLTHQMTLSLLVASVELAGSRQRIAGQ